MQLIDFDTDVAVTVTQYIIVYYYYSMVYLSTSMITDEPFYNE